MTLSPKIAALLSLLLPGASHVALGRPQRGLLAFVSCVALFFGGWLVLRDRIWFFALFEPFDNLAVLFKVIPINLLPDGLNVSCAAVASLLRDTESFAGQRLIRMPVAGEDWAGFLCGASGVLSALWAADAHWLAKHRGAAATQRCNPATAALLSWIVPGWGHWRAGQRDKAVLLFGCVLFVFVLGLAIAHGHGVDRKDYAAWWIVQCLFGGGTAVAAVLFAPAPIESLPPLLDYGLALTSVAGLMNLLVVCDAYTVAEERAIAALRAEEVPA